MENLRPESSSVHQGTTKRARRSSPGIPGDAEALGRLTNAEGGLPGRLTPTEDFRAAGPGGPIPESEVGEDRSGGSGGEARSARGRSPLVREGAPAAEGRGARAHEDKPMIAARAPGTSNTRRKKPRAPLPRVLAARVDALVLAYRGALQSDVYSELLARLADAKAHRTGVAVRVASHSFELHPRSRDGWWKMKNASFGIVFEENPHVAGWKLAVTASAVALATRGARACAIMADEVARALLGSLDGVRVRRADLCADFVDLSLSGIEPAQWLHRPRVNVADHLTFARHHRVCKCTGFKFGKSDVVARVYDKTEELRAKSDDEKRAIEEALWRSALDGNGKPFWQEGTSVTRVEFQFRGKVLDELWGADGGLRSPEMLMQKLDAIWAYGSREWLRLIVPGSATRRTRCADDPAWAAVQSVRFEQWDGEIPLRFRRRAFAKARLALGVTLSFAAGSRTLPPLRVDPHESGRDAVAQWTEREARAFLSDYLEELGGRTMPEIARTLSEGRSPRDTAAFLIERVRAAEARAAECWASTDRDEQ